MNVGGCGLDSRSRPPSASARLRASRNPMPCPGGAVRASQAAGDGRVRAFGEMVDLLRRTSLAAALRLEALWTELLDAQGIALVCG